jgi:lambda family phage portal protein
VALPPGIEFQSWDTGQPGDNFEPFNRVLERYIASGLRVSYVSLFGNVSDTTYSGGRTGVLLERDNFRMLHRLYKDGLRRPLHLAWMEHATLAGALRLPDYRWRVYTAAEFRARTWPWVDPLKDLQAAEIAIRNGLGCRTDYADERGMDVNELFEKLGKERVLAAQYGIDITGDQIAEPVDPSIPVAPKAYLAEPRILNCAEKGVPR